ncbi:hypothetical protein Avbf_18979, partial [Armadillidium vulgare]
MDNIEGDPNLTPMDPLVLDWKPPLKCNLESMTLQINSFSFKLKINLDLKLNYSVELNDTRSKIFHLKDEGLILAVINPKTCRTTLDILTYTSDVSGYRDLFWGLESILPGKLVLLASLIVFYGLLQIDGKLEEFFVRKTMDILVSATVKSLSISQMERPEGEKAVLISRNLRFALYQGLKLYPKAKSFILLEDDLLVAPDFY